MSILRNEIEEKGWQGIDAIMDLLEDNIYKMAERTDVMPPEIRKYVQAELETIIDKAWLIKMRKADVYMCKLQRDVRLP